METITNFLIDNGKIILLDIVGFWVLCAVIVAVWMPIEIKNALDMDSEGNFLDNRK